MPLSQKAAIYNENPPPPIVGRPQDSGARRTVYGNYGGRNHHKHNPHKLHAMPVLKRVAERVLETAKKSVLGGGSGGAVPFSTWHKFCAMTTPCSTSFAMPPLTLFVKAQCNGCYCLIMLTHNHEAKDRSHFLFVPCSNSGFPDPWVECAVPFKRGNTFFSIVPLMSTGGRAFQRPRPPVCLILASWHFVQLA